MGKETGAFKITFGGDIESLNSDILIGNLLSTTRILQEINDEVSSGKEKITINIKPISRGSYEISFAIIHVALISGLMNYMVGGGIAGYAKLVFDIFVDIHKIKDFLGGKKAASQRNEGNQVIIQDNHGTINVFQPYAVDLYKNNPTVNDNLNRSFRGIQKNENIENVQLKDADDKAVLNIPRKDFPKLYAPNEYVEENKREKYDDEAKLIIFKIVWERGYKWTFIYKERRINAIITDEDFYKKTIPQDSFREGDYFEARLKVTQIYDSKIKTFIDEEYEVVKIKNHIPTPKQQNIPYS